MTEVAANYANGPLKVVFAQTKIKTGAGGYSNNSTTNGSGLTANATSTMSILAASYDVLPNVKLHAGLGRSTSSGIAVLSQTTGTSGPADASSTQFGVTYEVTPVIVVMAQMAKVNDKAASNVDRKMVGLGADYKFSKTTRAYVRYDSIDYNSNGTAAAGSEVKRTAFGVSKAF